MLSCVMKEKAGVETKYLLPRHQPLLPINQSDSYFNYTLLP